MTTEKIKREQKAPAIDIWHCASCKSFHMETENVLLTFSENEFADFANFVADCYTQNALTNDFQVFVK